MPGSIPCTAIEESIQILLNDALAEADRQAARLKAQTENQAAAAPGLQRCQSLKVGSAEVILKLAGEIPAERRIELRWLAVASFLVACGLALVCAGKDG